MPVVGRAHDDRVDIVAREHFLVVTGREDVPVALAGGVQAAIEDVARGHELDAGDAKCSVYIRHPHATRADNRQADAVGGGDLGGAGLSRGCRDVPAGQRPADDRRRLLAR